MAPSLIVSSLPFRNPVILLSNPANRTDVARARDIKSLVESSTNYVAEECLVSLFGELCDAKGAVIVHPKQRKLIYEWKDWRNL
jgi:hypothetical protein